MVLFCLPDCCFLPNSLAMGQVVLLHAAAIFVYTLTEESFQFTVVHNTES